MGRRTATPAHFEPLTGEDAYGRLEFYARKFAEGAYNCLVVVGPPGKLKTSVVKRAVPGAVLISCNATHVEVFCELQRHPNKPIILDDADGLFGKPEGLRLLKALTDPNKPATVSHHTNYPERHGLQKTFQTASPVVIIDNAWGGTSSHHLAALEDRARLFYFDPPPAALHRRMAGEAWFDESDIYDFVGILLFFMGDQGSCKGKASPPQAAGLSTRLYHKAREAKRAGEYWQEYVLGQCVKDPDERAMVAAHLKQVSADQRCGLWRGRTGKGQSCFYAVKRKLLLRLRSGDRALTDHLVRRLEGE
jgi:hypothetical protein